MADAPEGLEKSTTTLNLRKGNLKADDFKLDPSGKLTVNNAQVAKLINSNIQRVPQGGENAIRITIGIDF